MNPWEAYSLSQVWFPGRTCPSGFGPCWNIFTSMFKTTTSWKQRRKILFFMMTRDFSSIISHSPQPLERLKEPSEKPQLQFTRLSGDDQTPSWPHLSGTIWRTPESNSCIMSPVPLTSALLGPGHTTAITGNLPRAYNYLSSCLLSVRGGSKEDRQKSSPIRTLYACFVFEQTLVWASLVAQSKESTCNVCVSEGFPDGASSQEPTCQCR